MDDLFISELIWITSSGSGSVEVKTNYKFNIFYMINPGASCISCNKDVHWKYSWFLRKERHFKNQTIIRIV